MIAPEFLRLMAQYNAWQNESLVGAANRLEAIDRERDCGAFFGSIRATFNHLLWGDRIWLSRFAGTRAPNQKSISASINEEPDWPAFQSARTEMDQEISRWADGATAKELSGDLAWHSGALGRDVSRPYTLCVTHLFNHQTHHRGQLHAMITAAGGTPNDTDLFVMPGL